MEKYPPEEHGERKRRRDCIGSWQARYRDANGEQRHKNFRTKKEADAFLDRIRTDVRTGTYHDPKRGEITVEAWWELWWPAHQKGRTTTKNRKLSSWNAHIRPKWGKRKLGSLTYMEIQSWMTNEVKGNATQTKVLQLLRMMLKAAVRDQRIPFNPATDVEVTAAPPAKHPDDLRPPTEAQYALVREQLPEYYRPLVDFAQETGLRWGEYTALRPWHLDLSKKGEETVKVREVVIDDHGRLIRQAIPKSVAGFRTVPLSEKAVAAVKVMLDLWNPDETVTVPEDGMHPESLIFRSERAGKTKKRNGRPTEIAGVLNRNNFRRYWIPAIKDAGIARMVTNPETKRKEWWPRVHDYRHALASRLHAAGVPEVVVQEILGQERGGRVTWLYTHSTEESVAAVRSAMETGRRLRAVS
ncbi:MAG: tyrosine-type recombinase/integrase [Pseudonocardia sp.]